ncbi:MAG: ribonuclease HIII [Verrucomicrobiota bacterium]|nr:ribonuclease HIII [Verrucomicrobiota bacterium]
MATRKNTTEESEEKKLALYTVELTTEQFQKIHDYCDHHLWEFFHVDYATYACRNKDKKVVLTAYPAKKAGRLGKLVIAGKGTQDFIQNYLEPEITGMPKLGYDEVHNPEWYELHAGLDEAGKGDFFGPVVAATVIADGDAVRAWLKAGVKDSKALNDNSILRLDKVIRTTGGVVAKTAWCGMEKYNELMGKPAANLNRLLAWLHSRALQAALAERSAPWGLLDQFTEQPLVQRQLKKDGCTIDLRMRTKAESDPVVAAASIVARAEFVRQMRNLSEKLGEEILFGASAQVREQGKRLVAKQGPAALGQFAKLHFRTAYECLGLPVPEKKVFIRRAKA